MRRVRTAATALLLCFQAGVTAGELTLQGATITKITFSSDTAVEVDAFQADDAVLIDYPIGETVSLNTLGGLPVSVDVSAATRASDGSILFAVDSAVTLPGSVVAQKNDIVRYDGSDYSLFIAGATMQVPASAGINALTMRDGSLVLSTDNAFDIGGIAVADEDLVLWNGQALELIYDGSVAGLPTDLDLDAIHALSMSSLALASFDGSGTVSGVAFDDEDLLLIDLAGGELVLLLDMVDRFDRIGAADLDAVFARVVADQIQVDVTPGDLDSNDRYGAALAIDGSFVAIGAPGDNEAGPGAGAVHLFSRNGRSLVFEGKLLPPTGARSGFGSSIAIDDSGTLVVGTEETINQKGNAGAVAAAVAERLRSCPQIPCWVVKQPLTGTGVASGDGFGTAVAIDGDSIAVGAPRDDDNGSDAGSVYVFGRSGESFSQSQRISPPNPSPGMLFGAALDLKNDKLIAGAPFASGTMSPGSVSLFDQVATNLNLVGTVTGASNGFGSAVGLDDTGVAIAVGSPTEVGGGAAYVFDTTPQLQQLARLQPDDLDSGSQFGTSVTMATPSRLIVGSPATQSARGSTGAVYRFEDSGAGFEQVDKIGPRDIDNAEQFGQAVAGDDESILVGAPGSDGGAGGAELLLSGEVVFRNGMEF